MVCKRFGAVLLFSFCISLSHNLNDGGWYSITEIKFIVDFSVCVHLNVEMLSVLTQCHSNSSFCNRIHPIDHFFLTGADTHTHTKTFIHSN